MTREFGRLLTRVWSDRDFKELPASAQRMYFLLISQRLLNYAGVIPLMVQKWALGAPDTSEDDILRDLVTLESREYIVTDVDTQELLVRSLIRNDGIWKQPNVLKSALKRAEEVESPRIRLVLAAELRKLGKENADDVADAIEPKLTEPFGDPIANPSRTLPEPFESAEKEGTPREPLEEGSGGVPVRGRSGGKGNSVKGDHPPRARTGARARGDPDFEAFYAAYPRKEKRITAEKAWLKAVKEVDPEVIIAAARRYAKQREGEDPKYTAQPATWLNGGRWMDEPQKRHDPLAITGDTFTALSRRAAGLDTQQQLPAGGDMTS